MAMVGAGPLTSTVWKLGDEQSGWHYRFNVFRQLSRTGTVSRLFHASDLLHLVKLTQVLAAVLADDGCLPQEERATLLALASELNELLQGSDLAPPTNKYTAT
jgi:hypothetical protein